MSLNILKMKVINIKLKQVKLCTGLFLMLFYLNHSFAQVTIDNGDLYFKNENQYLLGDGVGILNFYSNDIRGRIRFYNNANEPMGSLYGYKNPSESGYYFGLLDADGQWTYVNKTDEYTAFRVDNDNKLVLNNNGLVSIPNSIDANGNPGSGSFEIGGALRIDNNEIITNTNALGTASPLGKLSIVSAENERGLESMNPNGNSHFPYSNGWSYLSGEGVIFRSNGNTERMRIQSNGKVGIGNTAPNVKLEVKGRIRATNDNNSNQGVQIGHTGNHGFISSFGAGPLYFSHNMQPLMALASDGTLNIGNVGTPSDDYKLYVEKGVMTEKVKVAVKNSNDWADFVFHKDYELLPLKDVKTFVKTNRHLPGVPSAEEVVKNGINVAEMDAILLRQIEELWLHVIELKRENVELRNIVNKN